MFDLGLSLEFKDFLMVVKRPRAMFAGMLIACCPGGSSSNVFSKLAGGDVAAVPVRGREDGRIPQLGQGIR